MAERTVSEAIQWGASAIRTTPSGTPRLDAELLLGHVIGRTRTQLMVHPGMTLSDADWSEYESLVESRLRGTPIAYLTGSRAFMDREFRVGPGALVPRPETEQLVDWARAFLERSGELAGRIVVDAGTGPGTILLSLATALEASDAVFVGSDPSTDALQWATFNRQQFALPAKIELVRGDLLTWFGGTAFLVTANLPYLKADQIEGNWELASEPTLALDGGREGLERIERLVLDLPRVLAVDGAVALEIDPSQANAVLELIGANLPWLNVEVHRDLAGYERLVTGSLGR